MLIHVEFQAHQDGVSSTTANAVSNSARSTELVQAHKLHDLEGNITRTSVYYATCLCKVTTAALEHSSTNDTLLQSSSVAPCAQMQSYTQ
eukprot:16986-Heterococcus_DN1.PRE.1